MKIKIKIKIKILNLKFLISPICAKLRYLNVAIVLSFYSPLTSLPTTFLAVNLQMVNNYDEQDLSSW